MTVGTASDMVAVLDAWVAEGLQEEPLGSNHTILGVEFGFDRVAWCCITQSIAQTRIGLHCFHEAAVVNAVSLAERGVNGMRWLPANAVIRQGDLPAFKWADGSHHIACVRDPGTQVKFQTDAGNEHDRMYTQWRDRKYVMGFIRLPYGTEAPQPEPPAPPASVSEEDDMKLLHVVDGPDKDSIWLQRGKQLLLMRPAGFEGAADDAQQARNAGAPVGDAQEPWWSWLKKNSDVVTP